LPVEAFGCEPATAAMRNLATQISVKLRLSTSRSAEMVHGKLRERDFQTRFSHTCRHLLLHTLHR